MASIRVKVDLCHAGAVLAEDVVNDSGVAMLKAGASLTESTIEKLIRNGVSELIINKEEALSEEELEEKRQKIDALITKRMRNCETNNEMVLLKKILIDYRCQGG